MKQLKKKKKFTSIHFGHSCPLLDAKVYIKSHYFFFEKINWENRKTAYFVTKVRESLCSSSMLGFFSGVLCKTNCCSLSFWVPHGGCSQFRQGSTRQTSDIVHPHQQQVFSHFIHSSFFPLSTSWFFMYFETYFVTFIIFKHVGKFVCWREGECRSIWSFHKYFIKGINMAKGYYFSLPIHT